MEFDENLGILSKKAWDLVDKISGEIQSISFCRHCSEHCVYCGVADQTPLMAEEERERLIAIRDSLKDVETMLVFLQRLQLYQQQHCHAAISRLEESRLHLIDKIQDFQENGRKLDVIQELNACFGDEKMVERKIEQLKVNNRNSWFLVNFIRSLFSPWNWHNTAKIAIKLIVVSVSISSTYSFFYQSRQEYENFSPKCASSMDGKREFLVGDIDNPLDVSSGMG